MPEIVRGPFPEGGVHEGYVTVSGYVFRGGVGTDGGEKIGKVTNSGIVFTVDSLGNVQDFIGRVSNHIVYKGDSSAESGVRVGKVQQGSNFYVLKDAVR